MKSYFDIKTSIMENPVPGKPATTAKADALQDEISFSELRELEKHLDKVWQHLGIDFDFTRHFFDRINDPRNGKPITIEEIKKLFSDVYKQYGTMIAGKVKPETEGAFDTLLTDAKTNVNSPVILTWNKKTRQLQLLAKTVMRVKHFYAHAHQPRLTVQHFEPENTMQSKTYRQLKEWLGFNVPEVAPIASLQAVDDVDTTAYAVNKTDVLDKLNGYCAGISNHQYLNPYYPLNALWKKLSIIGINFDLKAILLVGDHGTVATPISRFGGTYGYKPNQPETDDKLIHATDGTDIPGGLRLTVAWQKITGIYTLSVKIEHGSGHVAFGESVTEDIVEGADWMSPALEPFHKHLVAKGYKKKKSNSSNVGNWNEHQYTHSNGNTALIRNKKDNFTQTQWEHKTPVHKIEDNSPSACGSTTPASLKLYLDKIHPTEDIVEGADWMSPALEPFHKHLVAKGYKKKSNSSNVGNWNEHQYTHPNGHTALIRNKKDNFTQMQVASLAQWGHTTPDGKIEANNTSASLKSYLDKIHPTVKKK